MRAVNGGFDKLFKRIVKGEISLCWRGSGAKVTWRDCERSRFGKSLGRPVSYGFLRIKTREGERKKKKKGKKGMEEGDGNGDREDEKLSREAERFKAHASFEQFLRMWEVNDDAIVDII